MKKSYALLYNKLKKKVLLAPCLNVKHIVISSFSLVIQIITVRNSGFLESFGERFILLNLIIFRFNDLVQCPIYKTDCHHATVTSYDLALCFCFMRMTAYAFIGVCWWWFYHNRTRFCDTLWQNLILKTLKTLYYYICHFIFALQLIATYICKRL